MSTLIPGFRILALENSLTVTRTRYQKDKSSEIQLAALLEDVRDMREQLAEVAKGEGSEGLR